MTDRQQLPDLETTDLHTQAGVNALRSLSVDQRIELYSALAIGAMSDPGKLSDWQLDVLSYGMFKDHEALDAVMGSPYEDLLDFNVVAGTMREAGSRGLHGYDWGTIGLLASHSEQDKDLEVPLGNVPLIGSFSRWAHSIEFDDEWMGFISPPILMLSWLTGEETGDILNKTQATNEIIVSQFTSGLVTPPGGQSAFGIRPGSLWDSIINADANDAARLDTIAKANRQRTITNLQNQGIEQLPLGYTVDEQGNVVDPTGEEVSISEWMGLPDQSDPPPETPAGDPAAQLDPYVGIDPRYQQGWAPTTIGTGIGPNPNVVERRWEPKYRMSDILDILGSMTPNQLMEFQAKAVRAGLILPDSTVGGETYVAGRMNYQTRTAMSKVLEISNTTPGPRWDSWQSTIDMLAIQGDVQGVTEEERPRYPRRAYLPPDYTMLSQMVKDDADRYLGRSLESWEVQLLTDQMARDHRTTFEAEERYLEQKFDIEQAAREGEILEPEEIEIPDWEARYRQAFDKHFQPEMQRAERLEDVEEQQRNLFSSFDVARSLMGR